MLACSVWLITLFIRNLYIWDSNVAFVCRTRSFQTEKGLFCSQVNAPWVRRKIIAFRWVYYDRRSTRTLTQSSYQSIPNLWPCILSSFRQECRSSCNSFVWCLPPPHHHFHCLPSFIPPHIPDPCWWNFIRKQWRVDLSQSQCNNNKDGIPQEVSDDGLNTKKKKC